MFDLINAVILVFQGLYDLLSKIFGYGWALIVLSILSSIALQPIEKWAAKHRNREAKIRSIIEPQLSLINKKFSGQEAWSATRRLYERYSYHPFKAMRLALFPLLQLPILFVAYYGLSTFTPLHGVSLGPVNDISRPDSLLFGLALFPFLMTVFNLLNTYLSPFTQREKIQSVIVALFFLLLLYSAPFALLLYWTANNFISLIKTVYSRVFVSKNLGYSISTKNAAQVQEFVFTLPLVIVATPIYLWANNLSYYSSISLLVSCTILLVIAGFVFGGLFLGSKYSQFCSSDNVAFQIVYVLLISLCFYCLLYSTISALVYSYEFIALVGISCVLGLIVRLFKFKGLNFIFTIFLVINVTTALYMQGFATANKPLIKPTPSVTLKSRPNIYYFTCESFQELDYVKNTFDFDSARFANILTEKGFQIYANVYSNAPYTTASLLSALLMGLPDPRSNLGNADIPKDYRLVLSGQEGNRLFEILKRNDYQVAFYLKGNSYFFTEKGRYLDLTDIHPKTSDIFKPIGDLNPVLHKFVSTALVRFDIKVERNSLKILENYLKEESSTNNPRFFMHHLHSALHTNPFGAYDYIKSSEWIQSGIYQRSLKKGQEEIISVIQLIDKYDPEAIVIFQGDHGVWRLRGFPYTTDWNANEEKLNEIGESLQTAVDDFYKVFVAIRLPSSLQPLENFSPANLFPKLFLQLSDEKSHDNLNKMIVPNISVFFPKGLTIQDGAPSLERN